MSKTAFFRNFLKSLTVGAVLPTSSNAVKHLCSKIDFDTARVIVEYGPGTGVFPRFLLEQMPPESKLILVEVNDEFCDMLRQIDDPRVHVVNDTSENVRNILADCGEDAADCIISGIPYSILGDETRERVLAETARALSLNGQFLVYQYSMSMKKHLEDRFERVFCDTVILNIPPLFIFECYPQPTGGSSWSV